MNATDPRQYDSPEMNWDLLGAEDARQYFRDILDSFIDPTYWKGKRALDVGCGVGQLFNWLKNKEVASITGIDPAESNIKISQEKYPWAESLVFTLGDFAKQKVEKFDTAVAILVFEHIENLNEAFSDVRALLKDDGRFFLMIGNKDSLTKSDGTTSVEIVRDLGNGAVETKTITQLIDGKQSVRYDIFRPIEQVREAAQANGFNLLKEKPVAGTKSQETIAYIMEFSKQVSS